MFKRKVPRPRRSSREFIDLILKTSGEWAVWNPRSTVINIGDYGTIDEQTGRFTYCGSIFLNPLLRDLVDQIPSSMLADPNDHVVILSSAGVEQNSDPPPVFGTEVGPIFYQAGFTFGRERGALLAIYGPQKTSFRDYAGILHHKELAGMCIITSVTRCSSYCLYLAGIGDNAISLALCQQASGGSNWVPAYGGGFCRKESSASGDAYTVSFEMQECRKKRRFWFW